MSDAPAPSAAPVLSLRGLVRTYKSGDRDLEVLKGVDLDIYPGEIVGLIGPSGSGKSSLLHAAGLLERPTGGAVSLGGIEVTRLKEKQRTRLRLAHIGFVYQFHHLLPELSALDNVGLPNLIAGKSLAEARARAADLLGRLGLADRMEHQPAQMSGGEQQRVAIARALANNPRLLLADEPTGNLDPTTSGTVFQSLFDLARIQGVACLIATHNMELAGFMDRVFALRDGHLEPWTRP
jgi:lipoprotein-releasing system ATP-binding protein